MALSAVACLGACLVLWAGVRPLAGPWWMVLPIAFLVWLGGLALKRAGWLVMAMYLMIGLAGVVMVSGKTAGGLAATALMLWGWDRGWLELARGRRGPVDRQSRQRLPSGMAAVKAAGTVAAATAVAFGFSRLRVAIPFCWLAALGVATWAGLLLLILAIRRRTLPDSPDPTRVPRNAL